MNTDEMRVVKMTGAPRIGKVEVKWIDGQWHAFMPNGVLRSAGINDIVDQVTEAWPQVEKGKVVNWSVVGNKFVVREIDAGQEKLSKSRQS